MTLMASAASVARHRPARRALARTFRVGIIAPSRFAVAEPFVGGLEAHIWLLARTLRERGHHVTLFAAAGSDPSVANRFEAYPQMGPRDLVRRDVSHDPQLVADEHRAYLRLMTRLTQTDRASFDVIHNHSLHYLPVAMAHRLPAPVVTTLHTPPIRMVELAMRTTRDHRSRTVAVSRHTAHAWTDSAGPVGVVHNGVDTDRWRPGPGGARLVWSGRIAPEKGVDLAIEAARIAGLGIDLAGPIVDDAYFERCVRPHLGPQVRHLGHLRQEVLAETVGRAAAALVTPRWDEPYGLVAAEALSCGTPVAAFARGGLPEILTPACGRLAIADDVHDLARCVTEAVGLSREAARKRALQHCSAATMTDTYEQLYREVGAHRLAARRRVSA